MPFFPETLLPGKDFEKSFNNTTGEHKTCVLFSLKEDSSSLLKIWGYAYNNPQHEHAEYLVLSNIKRYIPENEIKETFTLTFFMSYTPCLDCSKMIKDFLESRNGLHMKIKASKPYYFENEGKERGLCLLKSMGVPIKMMDQSDYEQCFDEFVDSSEKFTPWDGLNEMSKNNADNLDNIWKQCLSLEEEKETEGNARKRSKVSNNDSMIAPRSISVCTKPQFGVQDVSKPHIILEGHDQSPGLEENVGLGTRDSSKIKDSERAIEPGPGVKRKLDFSEK